MLGYEYVDPFELNEASLEIASAQDIDTLHKQILTCHLCDLSKSRTQSMPGFGNSRADVMFVDFSVSELEDSTNSYYGGRSGELLQNMITNVLELKTQDVFITHVVKCKPHNGKKELSSEVMTCKGYLLSQIELISPKVIVPLGQEAYGALVGKKEAFEDVRGHIMELQQKKLVPLYHPSFVLRNPHVKKVVYNDLKTIKSCL
jgi:DNA polymerase